MVRQILGRDVELRLGWQADFDTPAPVDSYHCMNFYELTLAPSQPLEDDPLLGCGYNGRDDTEPLEGLITHGGTVDVPLELNTIGRWLRGLLGDPVTTGAGPTYDHVFTSGAEALPVATLELEFASDKLGQHVGVMFESLRFDLRKEGGARRFQFGVRGKDENSLTASAAGNVTPSVFDRLAQMPGFKGQVLFDDVALKVVSGLNFNFTNNFDPDNSLSDSAAVSDYDLGTAQVSGSLTARYKDNALYDLANNGTFGKLELSWDPHPDYSLSIVMPRLRFARTGRPVTGPEGVNLNFDFRGAHDLPNTAPMLTVTLKNKVEDLT